MKNLVFLGPPGSGKGTQADILAKKFGYKKISTGDLIRDEIRSSSVVGVEAAGFVSSGLLVPDTIIISLFKKKIVDEKKGFIADGFPRTLSQAEALTRLLSETHCTGTLLVFYFYLPLDVLLGRVLHRRICDECNKIYNILTLPTKNLELCQDCGKTLRLREDDSEEVVKKRFSVYQKETEVLLEYYKKSLIRIEAGRSVEQVTQDILTFGDITRV